MNRIRYDEFLTTATDSNFNDHSLISKKGANKLNVMQL